MNVTLHDIIQDIVNDPSTYIDGDVNDDIEMTIIIMIVWMIIVKVYLQSR